MLGVFLVASQAQGADEKKEGPKAWTEPDTAAAEDPDFLIQGEYKKGDSGIQVAALSEGKFYVTRFAGGLPDDGWDGKKPETAVVERDGLDEWIGGASKVERMSPTLGAKPPADAVVLFDGEASDRVKGEIKEGYLWAGSETTDEYGSFTLHVEFRLPYKPGAALSSQDRGNSGLYLQNRYEVQVLDSFGVLYNPDWAGIPLKSDVKQLCGSFYKFKTPDVPMARPPLTWQTYDIDFTAPKFEGDKKVTNARISVKQNGVTIHDQVELPQGTGAGAKRPEGPKGPIVFQGHGNPVAYRNVWLVEKD
ncbi:MAG: DUF1080 domain-containing protein [Verrucomicrobiae bacterium]|nr:DUF1080 domain-containing protein [Verrucomicrobiae bacterium]